MDILLVVGMSLDDGTSAALCHRAFLEGFINNGYNIDVITVTGDNNRLPNGPQYYKYEKMSNLHKAYRKTVYKDENSNISIKNSNDKKTDESYLKGVIKKLLVKINQNIVGNFRSAYGSYTTWINNSLGYKSNKVYDVVISLSWPSASHLLVEKLHKKNSIHYKKWIQIWEDPWAYDLYGRKRKKIVKAEERLLRNESIIMYVTPGTLEKQKEYYPKHSDKMRWLPLPSYYQKEYPLSNDFSVFSYFGDYFSKVRNLEPFIQAASEMGIETYICGDTDLYNQSTENLHIYPRMPLDELEEYEKRTDVLVFVSNLGGGQIPGKIYQYSRTNKPILFILDGDEHEQKMIHNYFAGFNRYVFAYNDVESIKKAILLIKNKETKVSNKPIEYFSPENITKEIMSICEE